MKEREMRTGQVHSQSSRTTSPYLPQTTPPSQHFPYHAHPLPILPATPSPLNPQDRHLPHNFPLLHRLSSPKYNLPPSPPPSPPLKLTPPQPSTSSPSIRSRYGPIHQFSTNTSAPPSTTPSTSRIRPSSVFTRSSKPSTPYPSACGLLGV